MSATRSASSAERASGPSSSAARRRTTGGADDGVRVWLVERTYSDDEQNLAVLIYATPDGKRYCRKAGSHPLHRHPRHHRGRRRRPGRSRHGRRPRRRDPIARPSGVGRTRSVSTTPAEEATNPSSHRGSHTGQLARQFHLRPERPAAVDGLKPRPTGTRSRPLGRLVDLNPAVTSDFHEVIGVLKLDRADALP